MSTWPADSCDPPPRLPKGGCLRLWRQPRTAFALDMRKWILHLGAFLLKFGGTAEQMDLLLHLLRHVFLCAAYDDWSKATNSR